MNLRRPMTARTWAATLLCSISALIGPWTGGPASGQPPAAQKPKTGATDVEAILRQTADFYKKLGSLAVEIERAQKVGPIAMQTTLNIDFARPNKLAIRSRGNVPGVDIVSDGKTLSIAIAALKRYTKSEAPASLDDPAADPMSKGLVMGSLQGTMLGELISAEPYKMLMDGVKTSKYVGKEAVDGGMAHHLAFTQDQFDWEIWIAADGDPLVRKVVMDMTRSLAGSPAAAQFKDQKFEVTQNFKGWKLNAPPRESAFVFQPPAGSTKADSLMKLFAPGGGGNGEAPSPLVGKPAPSITLKRLDKGEFRLADHHNKDVVMIDFWATWCGPCVMELPILAEVANAYKDKGVTFYAINLRETPEEIKKFQEGKKLKFPVALDPEGKTGGDYGASAIPMLVLIDKAGVVRSVHVGYNPAIKTTLGKELDALIAGKDIPRPALETAKAPAPKTEGLKLLWSANRAYTSVATDAKGETIYALQQGGKCDVLDSGGKTIRSFALGGTSQGILRVARRAGAGDGLLAFQSWGPSVFAVKADGTKVWEEKSGQGVDDVWAADLDGDGSDEAIVGYNGMTGLHVFSPEGKRLWKRTEIGNVWHVTAGDLDGDGKPEVITTSAQGKVHVFAAADGKPVMQLNPGIYATMVRVAPGRAIAPAKGDLILVAGTKPPGQGVSIAALGADDTVQWTTAIAADVPACDSMAVTPDGKLAALGLRGGRVCVVDVTSGKIVASTGDQGMSPAVAWAARPNGSGSQLLVATGAAVNAFATTVKDASPGAVDSVIIPPIPALAQKGAATAYAAPCAGSASTASSTTGPRIWCTTTSSITVFRSPITARTGWPGPTSRPVPT